MTTSIDTDVIAALWNDADPFNQTALSLLQAASRKGPLVVCAPVYGELMAGPLRTEAALDRFFLSTGIEVDWRIGEAVWREAGRAYSGYAWRRKSSSDKAPRRILADFVNGAHAQLNGHALMTLDERLYRAAFPALSIVGP